MRKVTAFLILVVMTVLVCCGGLCEQEMTLTIESDENVAKTLVRYEWFKLTGSMKSETPSFAPVPGGFRIFMGMMLELPHSIYAHFDRYDHSVTWNVCYIPAQEAELNIFTGLITCSNADEKFSHVVQITKAPNGKQIYWDVKDHYIELYTLGDNGENEVYLRLGVKAAHTDGLILAESQTGEMGGLEGV